MDFKRILYYYLKRPTYPTEAMTPKDFEHLGEMFERQAIAGALIRKLRGKRILEIGSGFLPIYKYMDKGTYELISCVDPIIETGEPNARVKCYRHGIEDFEWDNSYDTVVLLGLGHTMGRWAFEAIDTILGDSAVKIFILEHIICRLTDIYVNRITKNLPELGYKQKIFFSIQYPDSPQYNKRQMEVWIR